MEIICSRKFCNFVITVNLRLPLDVSNHFKISKITQPQTSWQERDTMDISIERKITYDNIAN